MWTYVTRGAESGVPVITGGDDQVAGTNEFGEIELDPDPLKNIPEDLTITLERFVLVDDFDLATSRIDVLLFVLDEWEQVRYKSRDVESWVRKYGNRYYVIEQDDRGEWRRASTDVTNSLSQDKVRATIPRRILLTIVAEILQQDAEERIRRSESVIDILSDWLAYFVDDEKLVGHLVREHRASCAIRDEDDQQLIARHAELHNGADPA